MTLFERIGEFEVFAGVHRVGDDLVLLLYGGTSPHIGAIGIAQTRPSLSNA